MRFRTAGKMMPPDHTGKTTSLADADNVNELLAVKNIHQHTVSSFHQSVAVGLRLFFDFDRNLAHELDRRQIVLAQVSAGRLGQSRLFHKLDQADLRGNISVLGLRLVLRDHAGPSLQHGHGMNVALVVKELRHADFLTENSSYLCHISIFSAQPAWPLGYGLGLLASN